MAASSGKKTTQTRKNTGTTSRKSTSAGRKTSAAGKRTAASSRNTGGTRRNTGARAKQTARDSELFREIGLIVLFAAMVIVFLCHFGVIGPVGDSVSEVLFGLFGVTAYILPAAVFVATAFWFANEGQPTAVRKLVSGIVLFVMIGVFCDLLSGNAANLQSYDMKTLYLECAEKKNGGGCLAGSVSYLFQHYIGVIGTVLITLVLCLICIILLTERLLLRAVREGGERFRERSREDAMYRRQMALERRMEQEERRREKEEWDDAYREELEEARDRRDREKLVKREARRQRLQEREDEKTLRMNKKATGVTLDTSLARLPADHSDEIHEITMKDTEAEGAESLTIEHPIAAKYEHDVVQEQLPVQSFEKMQIQSSHQMTIDESLRESEKIREVNRYVEQNLHSAKEPSFRAPNQDVDMIQVHSEATASRRPAARLPREEASGAELSATEAEIRKELTSRPKKYMFPPLSRLKKGSGVAADSSRELKETALRLQQTLNTFGVKVTITDISQGPSVTRYELQPEQGVKVSRIVNLADDIKLNLAATDIRIEAPIPGKAAIGIEVPNKENTTVALRDILESSQFKEYPSNLAFAVGKDIAGQVVVTDIAKMPHMLIAGATGSGKSVCINTLIMSILYKAHPDDVKMIMVDPKVVELSVYNGIPHLLIPVVTDPKKASAALHWGVAEMTDRYKKFADFNVRDLKGYNKKVETMQEQGQEDVPPKMPQIVIIVDELADLMMVAPGEVEESICRLAQLARAAGIHLIIATQRPSVDVITGLIKANMPSRVAFSVSSGVDSRTILDMNGAEKLLGKGDMLFYPQGYSKPARIQGAFVSDKEVADVVDFLKNQKLGNVYAEDIEEKLKGFGSSGGAGSSGGNERDEYFAEAGRFIIDKDKASIGSLQRVLKIGFNRAARIMDQLAEYGVVGEEEGTKPRKVLMSMEQFEQLLEEI